VAQWAGRCSEFGDVLKDNVPIKVRQNLRCHVAREHGVQGSDPSRIFRYGTEVPKVKQPAAFAVRVRQPSQRLLDVRLGVTSRSLDLVPKLISGLWRGGAQCPNCETDTSAGLC